MQKPQVLAVLWGELQEAHGVDRGAGLRLLPCLRASTRQNGTLQQELGRRRTTTPLHAP